MPGKPASAGTSQLFAHGIAAGQRHAVASASGAIGIARIDQHGAHQTARLFQMKARDSHRRGLHAVLREDGGGGSGRVGDDEGEVVLLDFADSGIDGRVAIAEGSFTVRLSSMLP